MSTYVFIGGPADGERRKLDLPAPVIQLTSAGSLSEPVDYASNRTQRAAPFDEPVAFYDAVPLYDDEGGRHLVYGYRGLKGVGSLMGRLLSGYNPEAR